MGEDVTQEKAGGTQTRPGPAGLSQQGAQRPGVGGLEVSSASDATPPPSSGEQERELPPHSCSPVQMAVGKERIS